MALRQVRQRGDDILGKKAKPVKEITPAILALLDDMKETMDAKEGVGIAAPQVGMLKRMAIVAFEEEFYELINPEIVAAEGSQVSNEACLSVAGLCGDVDRPMKVTVKATDRNGDEYTVTAEDFMATVLCHELDHLDGVLFTDIATNVKPLDDEEREARKERRKRFAKGRKANAE